MAQIESESGGLWDKIEASVNKKQSAFKKAFLRLSPRPEPYRIRLASSSRQYRKHWKAFAEDREFPVSPAEGKSTMAADVAWLLGGWVPGSRFVALVIDREANCLCVMEHNYSVYDVFAEFRKQTGINPASRKGCDFIIRVERHENGPGFPEYTCCPVIQPSPFTDAELHMISSSDFDVDKFVSPKTPDEIAEMWVGLPPGRKYEGKAVEEANARAVSAGGAQPVATVDAFIENHLDSIFVPTVADGKLDNVNLQSLSIPMLKAHWSYYRDFGIIPKLGVSSSTLAEDIANAALGEDE